MQRLRSFYVLIIACSFGLAKTADGVKVFESLSLAEQTAIRSARPDDGIRNLPKMKASKKPLHYFWEV